MRALLLILFGLLSFPAFSSTYTKIANNGADLPDSALLGSGPTDWACTRDNRNGLLWEVKTTDSGLRDRNKTYTNYDDPTQPQTSAGTNPTQAQIDATTNSIGFAKAVNVGGLCGHNDWRMPRKDELANLLEISYAPMIDPKFFPNTVGWFWSGSPVALYLIDAWMVAFDMGRVGSSQRSYGTGIHVRLVRGVSSVVFFTLSLSATGSGSGTLTSNTGGINCTSTTGTTSGTCSASFASDTSVTLTATPATGSSFTGWDSSGNGALTRAVVIIDMAKNVTASFNSAALTSQTITFDPAPTVTMGSTGTISATASSGLPVTITSSTLNICTVSGSTVRGVAVGICTLAANQTGNSSFSPAAQVTQSFSIVAAPLPPGPPTLGKGSLTPILMLLLD